MSYWGQRKARPLEHTGRARSYRPWSSNTTPSKQNTPTCRVRCRRQKHLVLHQRTARIKSAIQAPTGTIKVFRSIWFSPIKEFWDRFVPLDYTNVTHPNPQVFHPAIVLANQRSILISPSLPIGSAENKDTVFRFDPHPCSGFSGRLPESVRTSND